MNQARTVSASFDAPVASLPARIIRLIPLPAGPGANELVSVGIPFPPDILLDANSLRILDESGNEVAAHVEPIVRWHYKSNANAIRSVLVQFRADLSSGAERRFSFDTSSARTRNLAAQAYADGQMPGKAAAPVPRVLAVLTPEWLSQSQVAGPQITRSANTDFPDYDAWFDSFYASARNYSYTADYANWLFDRATAIYKQYIRTGNPAYLQEAYNSTTFYRSTIDASGSCVGSMRMAGKSCDLKYNYTEPLALHYMLTGDASVLPTMRDIVRGWDDPTVSTQFSPIYVRGSGFWTERHAGFGWLALIHAYEVLGGSDLRARVDSWANALLSHVAAPPDGRGRDGCWRHDSFDHDQSEFSSNYPGCSPWMTTILLDASWQYWLISADPRVGDAVRGFATFVELHGWYPDASRAAESNGISSYYFPSSLVGPAVYANADGDYYTDTHNLELIFAYSLAYAFETDVVRRGALRSRIERMRTVFTYGALPTQRAFNWAFRGSSPFLHLLRQ
jgi:hypothetical protein